MNLLSLRYFIAIEEYASFTKASEYLFVTQPTLSRQILDLEEELGVQLFVRGRHSLSLTNAGANLLNEAKEIVRRCDNLSAAVRETRVAAKRTLSIGYQKFFNAEIMYDAIKSLSSANPDIELSVMRAGTSELLLNLQEGKCDVIFTVYTCVESMQNIECVKLSRNSLQIVVPRNHRLAARSSAHISELADENFILLERKTSPITVDYSVGQCVKNHFSPKVYCYANDPETAVMLVSSGKGITFLNSRSNIHIPENVAVLDIDGISHDSLDFVAAFKTDSGNPALPVFVSTINHELCLHTIAT